MTAPTRHRARRAAARPTSARPVPAGGATPDGGTSRIGDLEGYRGLAAVGVLVFHCYQFCRGGPTFDYAYEGTPVGYVFLAFDSLVDLFLVLSALVLYGPIARRVLDGRPPENARAFLLKRAARILPLYWVAILVVWASRNGSFPGHWVDLVEHLTFTQVYDSRHIFWTIGPAWSLAVEVHFYLLLAGLILLFSRMGLDRAARRTRMAWLVGIPAVLFVLSLAWNLAALAAGVPFTDWAVWFNPLAKAHMVAAGMWLAVAHAALRDRLPMAPGTVWVVRAAGFAALGSTTLVPHETPTGSVTHHLVATLAFTLLLGASVIAPPQGLWRRFFAHPVLLWLGATSYSIYLWHEPVLLWLDEQGLVSHQESALPGVTLTLLVTAIPVAALSHYVLDTPFSRLRALFGPDGRRTDYYADAATALPSVDLALPDGAPRPLAPVVPLRSGSTRRRRDEPAARRRPDGAEPPRSGRHRA